MQHENTHAYPHTNWLTKHPFTIAVYCLLVCMTLHVVLVLHFSEGHFTYTLDDPYIHLAVAEQIWQGHYGVNAQEYSAPASSIVWPFILAPASQWVLAPFVFNVAFALLNLWLLYRIFCHVVSLTDPEQTRRFIALLLSMSIFATNALGLMFIGMEHSFQITCALGVAYGLIITHKHQKVSGVLLLFIVLGPLVRYENLACSAAALLYLLLNRYWVAMTVSGVLMVCGVVGFSLFLASMGLDYFPASISAKSAVVDTGGRFDKIIENAREILLSWQGRFMLIGFGILLYRSLRKNTDRTLVAALLTALLLHFLVGQYGWYGRYEVYIWTFFCVLTLYLYREALNGWLNRAIAKPAITRTRIKIISIGLLLGANYFMYLISLPHGARNIYEQQYQMHRFVTDFYQKNVAVNDLGYVSYQNPDYVLDLWGLASMEALKLRNSNETNDWIPPLIEKHNVGLVMIFEKWFNGYPEHWIKLGELQLNGIQVTAGGDTVQFYAVDSDSERDIRQALNTFIPTLPKGVRFQYAD